jgi:ketosteroid isomerase-like protein
MVLFKNEILEIEHAFAARVKQYGLGEAFVFYAANDAVIHRENRLIMGKEAIKNYFENQTLKDITLEWDPTFIDVAQSNELAYSYGDYVFSAINEKGEKIASKGHFHTVWKRQPDGEWRFVWD